MSLRCLSRFLSDSEERSRYRFVSPPVSIHIHTCAHDYRSAGQQIRARYPDWAGGRSYRSRHAVVAAGCAPGLHFHLGSPIFEIEPYEEAIQITMEFAAQMRDKYGFSLRMFSPGGGFAVNYLTTDEAPVRGHVYLHHLKGHHPGL